MASPGVFIHSGTLGGRLPAFSVAADALLSARLPATTAPPTNATPLRRNRRRDVAAILLSMSVGSVIVRTPPENRYACTTNERQPRFQEEGVLVVVHRARRRLPRIAAPVSI